MLGVHDMIREPQRGVATLVCGDRDLAKLRGRDEGSGDDEVHGAVFWQGAEYASVRALGQLDPPPIRVRLGPKQQRGIPNPAGEHAVGLTRESLREGVALLPGA